MAQVLKTYSICAKLTAFLVCKLHNGLPTFLESHEVPAKFF